MDAFFSGAWSLFKLAANCALGYSLAVVVFGFSDASPRKRVIYALVLAVVGVWCSVWFLFRFSFGGFAGVFGSKGIWVVVGVLVAAARVAGVAVGRGRGLLIPAVSLLVFGGLVISIGVDKQESNGNSKSAPIAAPVVESCECSAGATCTGPRGGRYCLTTSGSKRYM